MGISRSSQAAAFVARARVYNRSAFTIVELLVVIAVIGILIALIIPAVQMARESARRTQCQNNLRQVGIGLNGFVSAHGKFPPGKKWSGPRNHPTTFDIAWSAILLPHIEHRATFDAINFQVPFTDSINLPATSTVIPIYLCPSTSRMESHRMPEGRLGDLGGVPGEGLACIDYLGISGPAHDAKHPVSREEYGRQRGVLIGTKGLPQADTVIEPPLISPARITDGLSYTMCVTECTGRGVDVKDGQIDALHGAWASGNNVTHVAKGINDEEPPKAWYKERVFSDHGSGANVLMCDASVHFMSNEIKKSTLRSLASRDGAEPLDDDLF